MDMITCLLTFESYNYNRNDVRMVWNQPSPVLIFKVSFSLNVKLLTNKNSRILNCLILVWLIIR